MAHEYNPRDPRFRRMPGARRRLPSRLMSRKRRGAAPLPRSRVFTIVTRILFGLAVLFVLLVLAGAGVAYGAYNQLAQSLAYRIDDLKKHTSFQTTRIYDRNKTLLYEFVGTGKRTRVPLDQISTNLINATIAIEDKTFFQNQGVDYEGILKAFLRAANAGSAQGGASTITQQLIKNIILTEDERAPEKVYQRKLTEIVLAQELSRQYSKQQILALYLNEINYGNLAYGIEAASNVYFNVHAKDLTLAQASLLAGLPQSPSTYDPINYLDGGVLKGITLRSGWLAPDYKFPVGTPPPKIRQAAVLTQLVEEGFVTEREARRAAAEDLSFADQIVPLNAPHFVFYVRKLLEDQYGQQFANKGLSIKTTLDLDLQHMVQEKANERIQELEERNIHNAAVVVMRPNTGEILAMVGSIDYNKVIPTKTPGQTGNVLDGQVNVTTRERQPGSALKPFTYLSALEQGLTPGTVIWDVPTEFPPFGPNSYKPQNYNGRWNGPLRLRTALANSLNMPAIKALKFAGLDHTLDLLHRAGISGLQRGAGYYGLPLTLGGGEVTPLDLTTAYNTVASGGHYYPPVAILEISDGNGKVIEKFTPAQGPQALNPDHVAIITNILSDDNARKPIWGLNSKLKLSRPAAVKTGTTNDWKDAWAVGFTPYVTVGVWTGNNNNEETAKVESISGGGVIWHNVMEELFHNPKFERLLAEPYPAGKLPLDFTLPADIVHRKICRLPGPFNGYDEDLFSPDMLKRAADVPTAAADQTSGADDRARGIDGCDVFKELTVARLGDVPVVDEQDANAPVSGGQYCMPADGVDIPPEMLVTIKVWNTPPPDPDEKVVYRWEGSGGAVAGDIPPCTTDTIAAVAPPGSVRMPDLRNFGENQAKERLAALGIYDVYVDYQTRDRIPDVYDRFAPYVVLSTLPGAGDWIRPGTTVVLGVRAPDAQPPPVDWVPTPTLESAPPAPPSPPDNGDIAPGPTQTP
ncbi:MAG TPA: transglycosylase domain-containing protein [Roseiflexaceae bacterium]